MRSSKSNIPLDEWQQKIAALYGPADESASNASLAMHMVAEVANISKIEFKGNRSAVSYSLAVAVSYLLALCSKNSISLGKSFYTKYPGVCPYCLSVPCVCTALVSRVAFKPRRQAAIDKRTSKYRLTAKSITLVDAQRLILQIYSNITRELTVEYLLLRLQGEIAAASAQLDAQPSEAGRALAHVFAHLLTIAGKLQINIENALYQLYIDKSQIPPFHEPGFPDKAHGKSQADELRRLWELCTTSNQRSKGKALEDFAFALFGAVPTFHVRRNVQTDTSEFDLVISINPDEKGGMYWNRYQPQIFVECKNRRAASRQGDISKMIGKAAVQGSGPCTKLIFFLSKNDFSKEALQQAKYAYLKGYLIVPIIDDDIQVMLKAGHEIDGHLRDLVEKACVREKAFFR